MTITPTYPGVYINEVPSGVRTIVGVPTAVAAFVGPARRGPVNRSVHLTSWADFERIFGGLDATSLMAQAVLSFYRNGGSDAEIVRVVATPVPARIDLGGGVILETITVGEPANGMTATVTHDANDATKYTLELERGEDSESYTVTADEDAEDNLAAKLADSALARPAADIPLDVRPAEATDVEAAGGGGALASTIDLGGGTVLAARYPGIWGDGLRARVDHDTADPEDDALYNLTVRDVASGLTELYRNVSTDPAAANVLPKLLQSSRLVTAHTLGDDRPVANLAVRAGKDPFLENQVDDDDPAKRPYTDAAGGDDGGPPTETDLVGSEARKSGMQALLDADIVNMLCIPPLDRDTDLTDVVLGAALDLCVRRRAMLLVDAPRGWDDVSRAAEGIRTSPPLTGPDARNAALCFPWIHAADPDGRTATYPPGGAVAGLWARTDATRGVWKAPAGIDASIDGVRGLTVPLTDSENGRLNPLGINCIRTFSQIGTVMWGARTMRGADVFADEYKYVPVRRLALFLEETLFRALRWVVFEPNDEPLWASIRLNVGAFMSTLYRQGAFQGSTPDEAFLVECDRTTNPREDVDLGIVNVKVGFAPLKPAEFVFVHIQQLAGETQA
ncbi:phage tail sheath subtilisin-like domain-containing protein [Actinomycetospora cinnamomea]|uniref:Tail sheath protein C-terminal domain-containing protein n=1 Tax=Actinomycetospora cinnamomea TaxID=663609 RepID=A0A2U1F885_9PSEU|nr:phage tail sheath subtilisin-like domain-containing protein [Actinomycetospora cinnamomea]PVZ08190.1 hypothetical protein C8D89_10973 [Actinomycetospora cinnamomea]